MNLSFWSDENRWFVPRRLGFGLSFNFKYLAKRFGWIKEASHGEVNEAHDGQPESASDHETHEQRLKRQIEASKYEDS